MGWCFAIAARALQTCSTTSVLPVGNTALSTQRGARHFGQFDFPTLPYSTPKPRPENETMLEIVAPIKLLRGPEIRGNPHSLSDPRSKPGESDRPSFGAKHLTPNYFGHKTVPMHPRGAEASQASGSLRVVAHSTPQSSPRRDLWRIY